MGSAPIAPVITAESSETLAAVSADVAGRLAGYVDDNGLAFPMEAHVATARKT